MSVRVYMLQISDLVSQELNAHDIIRLMIWIGDIS